jgi:alanine-glyoxylate transaminase/serine-glyoxylate transaminase/serine-pyruvate transaminase
MGNLLDNIEEVLLMGAGPSCVPPEVYAALGRRTLGHLDPYFLTIADELKSLIRRIMNTENDFAIAVSGTGSAGMEASFANLVEPGDRVLVVINGLFGVRMAEVATRLGGRVDKLEFPWGSPIVLEEVEKRLSSDSYGVVAVVHGETATGVQNPVAQIGAMLKGRETLYIVDTVTTLAGIKVAMDDWNCDALYSCTQKCVSCPPGLSPLSFSPKAMAKVKGRKTKVPNWYLDLGLISDYWGRNRVYHHTAPINMIYGLYQSLNMFFDEGPENVHGRHMRAHERLVSGLEGLGLKMFVEKPHRLPTLNVVCVPDGVDELAVRKRLRSEFKIEISGSLGPLAGHTWRIGLLGHSARVENVERLLDALRQVL